MLRNLLICIMAIAALWGNNRAADGYAVTTCGRWTCAGSPSGLFVGRFIDGPHSNVIWSRWSPTDIRTVTGQEWVSVASMDTWAREDVGGYMGMFRWSTNSDKWYSVMPAGCRDAHACGGNQVLVNHIDRKAIKVTHIPNSAHVIGTTQILTFATAGDFWVKPPTGSEGRIQDTLGNWVVVDQTAQSIGSGEAVRPVLKGQTAQRICLAVSACIPPAIRNAKLSDLEFLDVAGRRTQGMSPSHGVVFICPKPR